MVLEKEGGDLYTRQERGEGEPTVVDSQSPNHSWRTGSITSALTYTDKCCLLGNSVFFLLSYVDLVLLMQDEKRAMRIWPADDPGPASAACS